MNKSRTVLCVTGVAALFGVVAPLAPSAAAATGSAARMPKCRLNPNLATQMAPSTSPEARFKVSDNLNWAGYVVHPPRGQFRQAYLNWTEPKAARSPQLRRLSIWAGLGSGVDRSHLLLQAGTRIATGPSSVNHWFWYEWVGKSATITPRYITLKVNSGDHVSVSVTYFPPRIPIGGAAVKFVYHNYTTGKACYVKKTPPSTPGAVGETVVERVPPTGPILHFTKFNGSSNFRLNSATARPRCVGHWPTTRWDVTRSGAPASSSNPVLITARFNGPAGCSAHWYRP